MMKRSILALTTALALVLCLIPGSALAQQTDPEATIPGETQAQTLPGETQTETFPEETLPEETLPEETFPEETFPEETLPEEVWEEDFPELVTVRLTVIAGDRFLVPRQTRLPAADLALTVPWFDLEAYGMAEDGTLTLTHLVLYATEALYCGLDPMDCGLGYLTPDTPALTLDGDAQCLWGREGLLECFLEGQPVDLCQPLTGGGRVTLALAEPMEETPPTSRVLPLEVSAGHLTQGDSLILTAEPCADLFYMDMENSDALAGDIRAWYYAGTADEAGILTLRDLTPGDYCFAAASRREGETLSLPQARRVTVEASPVSPSWQMGDVNGDGVVDGADGACLSGYINGTLELSDQALALGDLSGDGRINILDVALIYRAVNTDPAQ